MPEEINRIVADEFSEYLFLHSDEAIENLRAEGIADERMHFVGNTMIDTLVAMEERFRAADAASAQGVTPGDYLLVTLHRPALVDGPLLADVIARLDDVSRELPVVFPVHPRTRKMMDGIGVKPAMQVHLTEPVPYLEFLSLEADARAVLTDSGGVQEETTYLGVPCFTLRDNTERPVTVRAGTNTLLGLEPERIADILPALTQPKVVSEPPLMWDGQAAKRVGAVIYKAVSSEDRLAPVRRKYTRDDRRSHGISPMSFHQSGTADQRLRESRAGGYESPRPDVQACVPITAKRILELGCSTGALGAALKARNGAFVFGVEIDPEYARLAIPRLDRVVVADAETFLSTSKPEEAPFDCLIGADVFEHLVDPWGALAYAVEFLEPGATVVISLPNIPYWPALLRIIRSQRWPRDDQGIFDRTHLRWFTTQDAIDLLGGAGLCLKTVKLNYSTHGLRLMLTKAWAHTPLRGFLVRQHIFVAVKPV